MKGVFFMGKNKIALKELLYILFCVFVIYILPLFLFNNTRPDHEREQGIRILIFWADDIRAWINGYGCFAFMLGAAAYGYFCEKTVNKGLKDGAVWLYILAVLPYIAVRLIITVKDLESGISAVDNYMPLIFAGTGEWLGRRAAGKNKGERLFYKADIAYIAAAALLLGFAAVLAARANLADNNLYFAAVGLLIISVFYGLLSEFEYVQENFVRAVISVSFLVTLFSGIYFFNTEEYAENLKDLFAAYTTVLFVPSFIVTLGVVTGYYLRIMCFGGDREYTQRDVKKLLIKCGIAVAVIEAVPICIEVRFRFCRQENICELVGLELSDAAMVAVRGYDNFYSSMDRDCVQKVIAALREEKGVNVRTLPEKESDSFEVLLLDSKGHIVLDWDMVFKGELEIHDGEGSGRVFRFVLPKQYYADKSTAADKYLNIVKNARPQTTKEKIDFINSIDFEECNVYNLNIFLREYVNDEEHAVRLALAEKFSQPDAYYPDDDLLSEFLSDEDKDIRRQIYMGLYKHDTWVYITMLQNAEKNETDDICRFYAILCMGGTWSPYYDHERLQYLYSMRSDTKRSDLDKLACNCALLKDERYEYILADAKACYARIPDTEEYARAKEDAKAIIDRAEKAESLNEIKNRDMMRYGNDVYDE